MDHIYDQPQFGEPRFDYQNLYSRMVKLFPSGSKFVEVGCHKGKSSSYMAVEIANSNKDIDFYCVDTWAENERSNDSYNTFLENMKPVNDYYFPVKTSPVDAAKKFEDNSLDFVFLNISEAYNIVRDNIVAWIPKVKHGGIIAGYHFYIDPHYCPGVSKAVKETLGKVFQSGLCFVHYKNKLSNFPTINCITIEESHRRRSSLQSKFLNYGIKNIHFHIFPRYKEGDCKLVGSKVDQLEFTSKGPVTSHLKAIKHWYNNTDEDYTFFCEDDLSLETVLNWNFNWQEFYNHIPKDWELVQLAWIRDTEEFFKFGYKLRYRCWCDWSGCAYLIKRNFAKKLIDAYYPDDTFILEYQGDDADKRDAWALIPTIETIIYSNLGRVYSFPLFVEDTVGCESTCSAAGPGLMHEDSYRKLTSLWKNMLCRLTADQLISSEINTNN